VHVATSKGHDSFAKVIGANIEDLYIDLYYWFEKSSKRKGVLLEYVEFCGHEYAKILKRVNKVAVIGKVCAVSTWKVQWTQVIFFVSEEFADQRFSRLRDTFTNPLTYVALLFQHASIPLFNNFNKLSQSEEPIIHMLHDSTIQLARSLANRIITPQVLRDTPVTELNLDDPNIYKNTQSLWGLRQSSSFKNFSMMETLVRGSIPRNLKQPKPILRTPSVTF